jgi:uncharacterized protein YbbK (DUF523 family)
MAVRPRVGISRCLAGDEVRYDGGHKRNDGILESLGRVVEWVMVCPEVEAGMGTPREPIELVARPDGVRSGSTLARAIGVRTGQDWTDTLAVYAARRAAGLKELGLAGFVLKARSPSCGPVYWNGSTPFLEIGDMRGLFAQALLDAMPDLVIADEDELADPVRRAAFLAALTPVG